MDLQRLLEQMIANPAAQLGFSVERLQQAGVPDLWYERIALSQGGEQAYTRLRSQADEGGAAIGKWHAPVRAKTLTLFATSLLQSRIWTLSSVDVAPGEEYFSWRISADKQVFTLYYPWDCASVRGLVEQDLLLRRIANELVDAQQGIALVCEFDRRSGGVAVLNQGSEDAIICNPLQMGMDALNYVYVEVAKAVAERPGVTGLGLEFKRVTLTGPRQRTAPFDQEYLQVRAGEKVLFPVRANLKAYPNYYVRGVYSSYIDIPEQPDNSLIRGRVFSKAMRVPSTA